MTNLSQKLLSAHFEMDTSQLGMALAISTPTRDWNDEGRGIVAVRGSPLTCVMILLARFSRAQWRICSMAVDYRETLGLSCKLNDWNTNIPTGTLPLGRHASAMCGWTSAGSPQK